MELSYINANPELAMTMAKIYKDLEISDYDTEGDLIFPLDSQGLRIPGPKIDLDHLKGFTVLGTDPVIITAVCSLYRDKLISSLVLENFISTIRDETTALPFARVRDVFLCSDADLSPLIQNRIRELRDQEQWEGLMLEYDPAYAITWNDIDNFIRQWFHEVTCLKARMNSGTNSFIWVFRVPTIPLLNLSPREFILSNYKSKYVRVPLHLKLEPNTPYIFIKLRYAIITLTGIDPGPIYSNYFTIPCIRERIEDIIATLTSKELETTIAKVSVHPEPYTSQSLMKIDHNGVIYHIV